MPNTERIKRRMDELNITQAQLAEKIGVATPTMCQKINNLRPFSLDEAEKVAEVLKIKDRDFGAYFFCTIICVVQNKNAKVCAIGKKGG